MLFCFFGILDTELRSRRLQGLVQSAFLWGYMLTQFIGGSLADKLGGAHHVELQVRALAARAYRRMPRTLVQRVTAGKVVMAFGIAWFSLASFLLPAASVPAVSGCCHDCHWTPTIRLFP